MNRRYRPYHRRLASSGGGLSAPLVTGKLMTRNICGTYGNGGVGGGLPTDRNFVEHLGLGFSFGSARSHPFDSSTKITFKSFTNPQIVCILTTFPEHLTTASNCCCERKVQLTMLFTHHLSFELSPALPISTPLYPPKSLAFARKGMPTSTTSLV
ncbi:hypothetical protein CDAR_241371 [Caerostris darwini]|uniref:Uncharacterized protein n=1 Tax=Caerostris darwini TaxID=1538125 RepID=A0AAV4THR1_9ARAC|nr:hypothetical protein CDAR_241371 [Caerostris darwini]